MLFGFKFHVIVNHLGDIISVKLTPANVDDQTPKPEMARELVDRLCGDKGYVELPNSLRKKYPATEGALGWLIRCYPTTKPD